MLSLKRLGTDHIACVLIVLMGAGALAGGVTYQFGNLQHMGAGFVPVVLGVLMVLLGLAIGLTATPAAIRSSSDGRAMLHGEAPRAPEWRGWTCIVGGVVVFVVLGRYGGMVPASFASVFVAAMGDRQNTLRSAAILAALVTVFGVAVFYYGLHLQMPLFQWGG